MRTTRILLLQLLSLRPHHSIECKLGSAALAEPGALVVHGAVS